MKFNNRVFFGGFNGIGSLAAAGTGIGSLLVAATMQSDCPPRDPPSELSGAGSAEEIMDDAHRVTKLAKLIEIEGYDSIEDLVGAVCLDTVSPAICSNEGCNFTCEMEPDQDAGYCEECHTNSMKAALVLAGLI